ncbi:HAD family hydrolase [Labedella phragmitis]|uniref:Tyrosine-protein kinase PtkA n=1 Tax=Labedella phragmitis TaxID=2498849 RepID=A0A3S3ZCP4_9MICO|nr:HAD hydrolase-like protein [Labedella phragmitis]RWZ52643.1 HAD family hydrolase [Labedella phragmitis]
MTTPDSATLDYGQTPISRSWSCILFDLDGTITDSAPGIVHRLALTLAEMGAPVPSNADLLRWVGPPILDSFRDFAGFTPEQSAQALGIYRRLVSEVGPYNESAVYPGMAGLIQRLHERGIPLAVSSSKPESQVVPILDHFGLSSFFTVICGASDDETRSAKADVVAEALRRLRELEVDTSRMVLVGDRIHDVEGAAAHGIPAIIVEWGYGSPAEAADAMAVVHSTDRLATLLIG